MHTIQELCEILHCCSQGNCLICPLANERQTDACNKVLTEAEELLRKQYEKLSRDKADSVYLNGLQEMVTDLNKKLMKKQQEVDQLSAKLRTVTVKKIQLENRLKQLTEMLQNQ